MKKIIAVCVALACVALAGCESRTQYGECKGIADTRNPNLEYKLSVRNTVLGVVFMEMIIPPVVVLANETVCPVGPAPKYADPVNR